MLIKIPPDFVINRLFAKGSIMSEYIAVRPTSSDI
jgi:hypothetical protein